MFENVSLKKYQEVYDWLSENIGIIPIHYKILTCFNEKQARFFNIYNNKINVNTGMYIKTNIECIKYHFNFVCGDFYCNNCKIIKTLTGTPERVGSSFACSGCTSLTSFIGSPKEIDGWFECVDCESLSSLIGFPKKVGRDIYLVNKYFSNCNLEKQKYNRYIDMWFELLESVSDDDKIEYFNNYKDKKDYYNNEFIIPKEVVNKYKIDFLLKYK